MNAAAIILAAGASRRLGMPKQQAVVGGKTLLERAVITAVHAGLEPVLVIVEDVWLLPQVQKFGGVGVHNQVADEGIASSIRCGIHALKSTPAFAGRGAVLMTCDQVGVTHEHLRALVRDDKCVTASEYDGRKGVPEYFPRSSFPTLMMLKGDVGARELLRGAASAVDERLALDIDTPEDLARAMQLYGD